MKVALLPPQSRRVIFTLTDGEGAVANATIEVRIITPAALPLLQAEGESSESIFGVLNFSKPSLTQQTKIIALHAIKSPSPIAVKMPSPTPDRSNPRLQTPRSSKISTNLTTPLSIIPIREKCVIVGADRITARGNVAYKFGTYGFAVVARHHGVPFCVAVPSSPFGLTLMNGPPADLFGQREVSRFKASF